MLRTNRPLLTACLAVGIVCAAASPAAAVDATDLTGSAYSLSVEATVAGSPLVKVGPEPSGVAYPPGVTKSVVEIGPDALGLVSAKVLTASSDVDADVLQSEAKIAEAVIKNVLRAELVTAQCQATADGDLRGSSEVAELEVLGQKIDTSTPGPISVGDTATVTFNEQIREGDTLTVNAVHVKIGGSVGGIVSADIVLSQARCTAGRDTDPTTTTTVVPPGSSTTTAPPASSSTQPGTTSNSSQLPGSGDDGQNSDVTPVANDGDLAETGVSGLAVMIPIAVLLVGGGLFLMLRSRRARPATPSDPQN